MQTVQLGRTGLQISPICLGFMLYGSPEWNPWAMEEEAARPIVRRAFEAGINFFDTGNSYSNGRSEELLGAFWQEFGRRDEVVLATKVFLRVYDSYSVNMQSARPEDFRRNRQGLGRKNIFHSIDTSLKRLNTDYVDLYQIHRWDPRTPIEETMEALHDVVRAGKARYIGASSMAAWQFAKAQQVAKENGWTRFVSMQNHYNLVYREEEREMIPLCQDQGVAVIPYSPLARGFLAGNRTPQDRKRGETLRARTDDLAMERYYEPGDFAVVEALRHVAAARGEPPARIAYAWLLHKGVSAPIIGASKTAQIDDALAATEIRLTAEEIAALEAPYKAKPMRI